MNAGYTDDGEDQSQFHLCPICTMKLRYLLDFNVNERWETLKMWCNKYNFLEERDYIDQLLETNVQFSGKGKQNVSQTIEQMARLEAE